MPQGGLLITPSSGEFVSHYCAERIQAPEYYPTITHESFFKGGEAEGGRDLQVGLYDMIFENKKKMRFSCLTPL